MKQSFYILLIWLLTSCSNELPLDFSDKWILLSTTHQGDNKNVRSSNSLEIIYDLGGEVYEAIKFNARDSTVTIPGLENRDLKFSYSSKTHRLRFYRKDIIPNELDNSLIDVYEDNFEVLGPGQSGIITLSSENTSIKVLPLKTMIEKSINYMGN
jgi:hypothetical protein